MVELILELNANVTAWSYGVEGQAKTCAEFYCELASSNYVMSPRLAATIDISRMRTWKRWEKLLKVCSHIAMNCLYEARVGRPDILWSVSKLARAVTKWTRSF